MNIKLNTLKATNEVIKRLNNMRRWARNCADPRYSELAKQALNCAIAFILASEAEARGMEIIWERFPKIALYRAFQKSYINYDTPESILKRICELGNIKFEKVFSEITDKVICELTDEEFIDFLKEGCGTNEEEIYKAATRIATLLELYEVQHHMNGEYASKHEEVFRSFLRFVDIPGFEDLSNIEADSFQVFKSISRLRNQNRWSAYSYLVDCSVLGHLFDTAVFAYFMALDKGKTEKVATRCFFIGIFHDIPETFTSDIPSPIKDMIPGFRELTEKFELQVMEEKFYPVFSKQVQQNLRKVMMEEEENHQYKTLMKGADYLSAVSEIWRQIQAGTNDPAFFTAMKGHKTKFEKGIAELTPVTKDLFEWLYE